MYDDLVWAMRVSKALRDGLRMLEPDDLRRVLDELEKRAA